MESPSNQAPRAPKTSDSISLKLPFVSKTIQKILYPFFTEYREIYEMDDESMWTRFLPILLTTESLIHECDKVVEGLEQSGRMSTVHDVVSAWYPYRDTLLAYFEEEGVLDDEVVKVLDGITRYAEFECSTLLSGKCTSQEVIDEARASRSCDLHVLHILCHKLSKRGFDRALFDAVCAYERYIEIRCDLVEYESDIQANELNIYRLFVQLYGLEGKERLEHAIQETYESFQEAVRMLPQNLQEVFGRLEEKSKALRPELSFPIPEPILES